MAWTTPRTWTVGELVTAAMMNTHVRDNLSFLGGLNWYGNSLDSITDGILQAYIHIRREETSGTNGGSSVAGSWQTYPLNTEATDTDGLASVVSNQITLAAGTYLASCQASFLAGGASQIRLQDVDTPATLALGLNSNREAAGKFTLSVSRTLELQYRVTGSSATTGLGTPTSWGTEVYADVRLWKVG